MKNDLEKVTLSLIKAMAESDKPCRNLGPVQSGNDEESKKFDILLDFFQGVQYTQEYHNATVYLSPIAYSKGVYGVTGYIYAVTIYYGDRQKVSIGHAYKVGR